MRRVTAALAVERAVARVAVQALRCIDRAQLDDQTASVVRDALDFAALMGHVGDGVRG